MNLTLELPSANLGAPPVNPANGITLGKITKPGAPGRKAAPRTTASAQLVIAVAALPAMIAEAKILGRIKIETAPIMTPPEEIEAVKTFYREVLRKPVPANVASAWEEPEGFETLSLAELAKRAEGGNKEGEIKLSTSQVNACFDEARKAVWAVAQKHDAEVAAFIAAEAVRKTAVGGAAEVAPEVDEDEDAAEGENDGEAVENDEDAPDQRLDEEKAE